MSIKQIDQATVDDGKGVGKKIDEGAERLIFDVLQSTQYSTPIASTVRELATNAWDSQREKEMAIEILSGEKKVEDYYITREGKQYADSNFDPSYYDLDRLDADMDQVELRYTKNMGAGFCDLFEVIDFGVGLGGRRLEGILSLGFSTKRNTTEGFGAFGLGAKVALSTGVPFYSIDTVHNGKRFSCNCYPYTTKFTIPKFDIEKGVENPYIEFQDGKKVYYQPTDEKNRTTVSFGVKKHNRTSFKEAIEEQLIYVDNVIFTVVDAETDFEHTTSEGTKAEVIYNSESLILSEGTVFNKPHIVVVKSPKDQAGINYGMVDFRELEMQEMYGSIGFKCPIRQSYRDEDGMEHVIQDGVSVTPSREKVIWDDATKEYIQQVVIKATEEAGSIVEDELKDAETFFEWLQMSRSIFANLDSTSVLGRVSNIIDTKDVSPKYSKEKLIRYTSFEKLFAGVQVEVVTADYRGKPNRAAVKKWSDVPTLKHLYFKDGRYSPAKDIYLCQNQGHGSFLTFAKRTMSEEDKVSIREKVRDSEKAQALIDKQVAYMDAIWKAISEDPAMKSYEEIDVPKEIEDKLKEVEAEAEVAAADPLSPSERRKLEEKEVGFMPRLEIQRRASYNYDSESEWVLDKIEPKRKDLLHTEDEVYYTSSDQRETLFDVALMISGDTPKAKKVYDITYRDGREPIMYRGVASDTYSTLSTDKERVKDFVEGPQLIQLRQDLIKKAPTDGGLRPIHELYKRRTRDNVLTMHPYIVNTFTARTIGFDWNEFGYMKCFANVDMEIHKKFKKLEDFMKKYENFSYIFDVKAEDNVVIEEAERLWEFQKFCMFADEDMIKEKSKSMFFLADVKGAHIIDMEIFDLYKELCDYNTDVGGLLNLLDDQCFYKNEGAQEVRRYLKACSRDNWKWSSD